MTWQAHQMLSPNQSLQVLWHQLNWSEDSAASGHGAGLYVNDSKLFHLGAGRGSSVEGSKNQKKKGSVITVI